MSFATSHMRGNNPVGIYNCDKASMNPQLSAVPWSKDTNSVQSSIKHQMYQNQCEKSAYEPIVVNVKLQQNVSSSVAEEPLMNLEQFCKSITSNAGQHNPVEMKTKRNRKRSTDSHLVPLKLHCGTESKLVALRSDYETSRVVSLKSDIVKQGKIPLRSLTSLNSSEAETVHLPVNNELQKIKDKLGQHT